MKLQLPYFRVDGRVKYALGHLEFLLDTISACSVRVAWDLVHNRFVNLSGISDGTYHDESQSYEQQPICLTVPSIPPPPCFVVIYFVAARSCCSWCQKKHTHAHNNIARTIDQETTGKIDTLSSASADFVLG